MTSWSSSARPTVPVVLLAVAVPPGLSRCGLRHSLTQRSFEHRCEYPAYALPLESWRVSLCGRLAWCHPRVMGWRPQRRFSLNLSSLCVTDLTAVAIHNAATTAVAVLSGDACSGKPPFTGHFCGTGICESPGQA